jgi:hypothetical protein
MYVLIFMQVKCGNAVVIVRLCMFGVCVIIVLS